VVIVIKVFPSSLMKGKNKIVFTLGQSFPPSPIFVGKSKSLLWGCSSQTGCGIIPQIYD
jgi:hypothetical protein